VYVAAFDAKAGAVAAYAFEVKPFGKYEVAITTEPSDPLVTHFRRRLLAREVFDTVHEAVTAWRTRVQQTHDDALAKVNAYAAQLKAHDTQPAYLIHNPKGT
jgi:hypothetical protein